MEDKEGSLPGGVYRYRKWEMAASGQRNVPFAASLTVKPCRKGSVLDALILIDTTSPEMATSEHSSVVSGSNLVLQDDVYSDTLRNPKKAVVKVAHSMSLSSCALDELNSTWYISLSKDGVTGAL